MTFSKAFLIGGLMISVQALALDPGEPSYCEPKTFFAKEVKFKTNIQRPHMFKLGDVLLLGSAVGNSSAEDLMNLASTESTARKADNFCTWYFNEGNANAERNFTHIYLSNPSGLNLTTGPVEYEKKLSQQFARATTSFVSCAVQHKYISMGCNGQKHRGPTVFGMLLGYSGCNPVRAATIVNTLWGLNGVSEAVRTSIIARGKKLGDDHPEARLRLQQAFGL